MNKETHQGQLMGRSRAPDQSYVEPTFCPQHTESQQYVLGLARALFLLPIHLGKSRIRAISGPCPSFPERLCKLNSTTKPRGLPPRSQIQSPGWAGQGLFPGFPGIA